MKPGDYENNCQYAPYAVFQVDLDTKKYKQFNFEGIALYKGKMWGFANVSAVSGEPVQDSVIHHPGITFDDRTFCFKFNGSVTAGTPMKSVSVEDGDSSFQCKNVEAMAIDSKNTAYCLKCDKTSLRAALYKTETPEKGNVKDDLLKTAIATYNSNNCLHHCNGMTFNPEDGLLYVSGYPFSTSPATHVSEIIAMNTAGTISRRYRLDKAQYGISYYGKSDGNACFLLFAEGKRCFGN